jgi:hypothetical protein
MRAPARASSAGCVRLISASLGRSSGGTSGILRLMIEAARRVWNDTDMVKIAARAGSPSRAAW